MCHQHFFIICCGIFTWKYFTDDLDLIEAQRPSIIDDNFKPEITSFPMTNVCNTIKVYFKSWPICYLPFQKFLVYSDPLCKNIVLAPTERHLFVLFVNYIDALISITQDRLEACLELCDWSGMRACLRTYRTMIVARKIAVVTLDTLASVKICMCVEKSVRLFSLFIFI